MSGESGEQGLGDLPIWKLVPMAFGTIVMVLGIIVATEVLTRQLPGDVPRIIKNPAIGLVITLLAQTVYARVVMRRPLSWFLFTGPDRSTIRWTIIGLAFPAVVAIVNILVQRGELVEVVTDPRTVLISLVASLIIGLFTGILEEVIFRGMLYRLLEDRWNAAVAIIVPALAFSFLHTGRAGSQLELWLVVTRVVLGGILFGLIVYRTRNLWNAIAVHAGWNFLLGARIVSVAQPGSAPDTALVRIGLTETDFLGTAVSMSNTPTTTLLLLIACGVLLFGPVSKSSGVAPRIADE